MQMDAKTTWWLTFLLVAVQGLNSVAWASFNVNPHVIAGISQGVGYMTTLLLFAIHGTIPGVSSVQMPKAVIAALAIGLTTALLSPGTAHAQNRIPQRAAAEATAPAAAAVRTTTHGFPCDPLNLLPGCNVSVPGQDGKGSTEQPVELDIWQKIATAALPDLDYASQLAAAAGTPGGGVRKQCWDALIAANKMASGMAVKDANGNVIPKPDPHLFTDVESLAELLDNLAPKGPLWTACAGAAQLAATSVLTFINAAVTGAAGLAALGVT